MPGSTKPAAGDSDQIWVGHVNGEIYRTTDGTAELPHWQLMGESGPNPLRVARYCTRIVTDPRWPAPRSAGARAPRGGLRRPLG